MEMVRAAASVLLIAIGETGFVSARCDAEMLAATNAGGLDVAGRLVRPLARRVASRDRLLGTRVDSRGRKAAHARGFRDRLSW
jgi:hypothetical protein